MFPLQLQGSNCFPRLAPYPAISPSTAHCQIAAFLCFLRTMVRSCRNCQLVLAPLALEAFPVPDF